MVAFNFHLCIVFWHLIVCSVWSIIFWVLYSLLYTKILFNLCHMALHLQMNIIWLSAVCKNNYVLIDDSICCVSKTLVSTVHSSTQVGQNKHMGEVWNLPSYIFRHCLKCVVNAHFVHRQNSTYVCLSKPIKIRRTFISTQKYNDVLIFLEVYQIATW